SLRTFHRPGPGNAPETTTVWWSTMSGTVSGAVAWAGVAASDSTGDMDCVLAATIGGNSSRARHSILIGRIETSCSGGERPPAPCAGPRPAATVPRRPASGGVHTLDAMTRSHVHGPTTAMDDTAVLHRDALNQERLRSPRSPCPDLTVVLADFLTS